MAQWVGAQGRPTVSKNKQKHPHVWRSPREPKTENEKNFFSILTRRLVESIKGLNSSLALAAGDSWPKNCEPIYWFLLLLEIWVSDKQDTLSFTSSSTQQ